MVTHELSLWTALGLILGSTMLLHLPRLDKQNLYSAYRLQACLRAPLMVTHLCSNHKALLGAFPFTDALSAPS